MRVWLEDQSSIIYLKNKEGRKKEIGYARKNSSVPKGTLPYNFYNLKFGTERKIVYSLFRRLRGKEILETLLDHGLGISQKSIAEEAAGATELSKGKVQRGLKRLEEGGLIKRLEKSRVKEIEEKLQEEGAEVDFSPILEGKGWRVKIPTKKGLELAEPELLGKEREYGILEFGELSVEPWGSG